MAEIVRNSNVYFRPGRRKLPTALFDGCFKIAKAGFETDNDRMNHPLYLLQRTACVLVISATLPAGRAFAQESNSTPFTVVSTASEPVAPGKFQPTWDSLKQYQCPQWFRDAKFGIWAHWGAQCEPEDGDWYARGM